MIRKDAVLMHIFRCMLTPHVNSPCFTRSLFLSSLQRFVEVYRKSQMPRFLNLLGRICVCKQHPVVFVQGEIVQELIVRSPEILPWLELVDGNVLIHLGEITTIAAHYLKTDHEIMKLFADKFGFADRFFRNIKIDD